MTSSSSRYDYSFNPDDDSTAARVCRLVGHGRQVLELGCAAGAMSAVMTRHYGCQVTGVEYDPAAAAEAREHCAQVHVLSLDEPGWVSELSGAAFDTVVAADVLEHLRNPQACLRALRELLPADGQLVVSVPSLANSGVLAGLLLNRFDYRDTGLLDKTHIHFFTSATLGEALVDAGFEVTDVETVDAGDWHPEFAHLWKELPEAVRDWLKGNPAGQAFQVVMRAVPAVERTEFVDPFGEKQRAWLAQVSDTLVSDTQVLAGETKVSDTQITQIKGSDTKVSDPNPSPGLRNRLYSLLRPIYRRLPFAQRIRQRLAHRKALVVAKVKEGWHSAENLKALQALASRRFEPAALPGPGAAPAQWPDVDVSVVTYNSQEWVQQFVDSLVAQHYPLGHIHLWVVDNGSTDGTADAMEAALVPHREAFGGVQVVRQGNVGFGAGHDAAIRAGGSAYCLVTNIDLAFREDSLTTLVAAALEDTGGQVASWEVRQMPYEHPKHYDPVTLETNWSSHACILLRRQAYEAVGGYDPKIFMYAEDVELSYRFRSFGYALKYVPRAVVHHYTYKQAGEVKPMQFTGSTQGNVYLRCRYGQRADRVSGLLLYGSLFFMPAPFPGARKQLLANGRRLLSNWRYFSRGKGPAGGHFPFRAFDYEMRREGAFLPVDPVEPAQAPVVSVVMRTYAGRGVFLNQAMQSVFNQTYPAVELVVVQDGGDSLQAQVMQAAARAPAGCTVRFVANPKLGRSAAGNAGLAAATGQYLMFLDDDDLLYADHIETLAGQLVRNAGLAAAYALATEVLTDVQPDGHYTETVFQTPAIFHQEWSHEVLLDHNFIPIQAIVFRRELFETRGGFDETLDQLEDWHLWLRYGYGNTFAYVPKTTSLFRSPASPDVRAERAMKLHAAYDEALCRARQAMAALDAGGQHD